MFKKMKKIIIGFGTLTSIVVVPIATAISCHEGDTQCNDGTFSNAKGRGACSHHDGVRDWDYHE
ncbi:hypothetical protein [Mycoplasma todarodis]|uniref:hypothetical protein n=1 Tax=Mycoplasma todarodis TaxID=1937191 RepID=UPI003B3828F2